MSSEDNEAKQPEAADQVHPLRREWTLWYAAPSAEWGKFDQIYTFNSVEQFWGLFNNLKPPSDMEIKSNVMLFRKGVRPEWEDPFNAKGGMWRLSYRRQSGVRNQFDTDFLKLVMLVIGEQFGEDSDEVCGVMLSPRKAVDRIELWVRTANRPEVLSRIETLLQKSLASAKGVSFTQHDKGH